MEPERSSRRYTPAPSHSKYEVTSPSITGSISPLGGMCTALTATRRNGAGQFLGRTEIQEAVDVGQMAAVEPIELHAVGGIVTVAWLAADAFVTFALNADGTIRHVI
jgi:hypothetical protein